MSMSKQSYKSKKDRLDFIGYNYRLHLTVASVYKYFAMIGIQPGKTAVWNKIRQRKEMRDLFKSTTDLNPALQRMLARYGTEDAQGTHLGAVTWDSFKPNFQEEVLQHFSRDMGEDNAEMVIRQMWRKDRGFQNLKPSLFLTFLALFQEYQEQGLNLGSTLPIPQDQVQATALKLREAYSQSGRDIESLCLTSIFYELEERGLLSVDRTRTDSSTHSYVLKDYSPYLDHATFYNEDAKVIFNEVKQSLRDYAALEEGVATEVPKRRKVKRASSIIAKPAQPVVQEAARIEETSRTTGESLSGKILKFLLPLIPSIKGRFSLVIENGELREYDYTP